MVTREDNDLLTRVEGDWPMGQIMRRHWLPACLSEEVAKPDGAPVRTRMLGEDLVVFRDTKGRLGILGEHCLHRRASLAFGRNEDCGLRCLYHGWKFDVDGNILDQACEPEGGRLKLERRQKSYPARESGGFVWVYMGPAEEFREFEPPIWAAAPSDRIAIVKMRVACNWAQVLEGSIDSAHSSSLHSTVMPSMDVDGTKAVGDYWPRPSTDKAPRMQFQSTSFGFRFRQTGGQRVFIDGLKTQRQLLDDFDLAFRRQAQHGEMLTHDVVPIRIHGVPHAGLILATRSSAAKKSDHVCRCSFSAFLPSGISL